MRKTSQISMATAAAAFAALMATPLAAEPVKSDSAPDKCSHSVGVIGASMGPAEEKSVAGKPMLLFVVRSNGTDYDVTCDAETGLVKDVSVRIRPHTETN
ncbi:MAG: hypothetical protein ACT4N2_00505 [Hyphomicrobium sp.]